MYSLQCMRPLLISIIHSLNFLLIWRQTRNTLLNTFANIPKQTYASDLIFYGEFQEPTIAHAWTTQPEWIEPLSQGELNHSATVNFV